MTTRTLGLLAAGDPRLRGALEALGIDYVSSGDRSLVDAAAADGISISDIEQTLEKLNALNNEKTVSLDSSLDELIDHLIREHRSAGTDLLSHIAMQFSLLSDQDVARSEGFRALRVIFRRLAIKVREHKDHEEAVIFPLIVAMEKAWVARTPPPPDVEGGLRKSLAALYLEHDEINRALKLMRTVRLSTHCAPRHPECRRLLNQLASLEAHLHASMNLENFVLFPRALALEDEIYAQEAKGATA
jgi:regulator of cell morphogenesis and NO signaling